MRLILEKDEIIAILGKHFDAELDPEKVVIRTSPLEIEVSGLPLTTSEEPTTRKESKQRAPVLAVARDDADTSDAPPEPGLDGVEPGESEDFHPAAMLAKSKQIERELDEKNPNLAARRAGRFSLTPPKGMDGEIE